MDNTPDQNTVGHGRLQVEITLTVEGEQIPVTITEPGPLEKIRLVEAAPPPMAVQTGSLDGIRDFAEDLIGSITDFPTELLNVMPMEQFRELLQSSIAVLDGKEPTIDNKYPHDK